MQKEIQGLEELKALVDGREDQAKKDLKESQPYFVGITPKEKKGNLVVMGHQDPQVLKELMALKDR